MTTSTILALLAFLAVFGLLLSGVYLLVESPLSRKRLRARLAAVDQMREEGDIEAALFRQKVFSEITALNRLMREIDWFARVDLFVQQAGVTLNVANLLTISFALGFFSFLVTVVVVGSFLLALLAGALAGLIPAAVLTYKRKKRFQRFTEQFPEAMDVLARAVRAGYAFTSALQLIADELPDPVSREFRITYDQQNLGLPLREALGNMLVRLPLTDVRIFVSTLQIQRESGGNLAEVLDNLSKVIRERFKLFRQVRILTAEGRLSMYILTALPPVAALLFTLISPGYIMPLFDEPLGLMMISAAIVLQIVGFLVIKKIVTLKV